MATILITWAFRLQSDTGGVGMGCAKVVRCNYTIAERKALVEMMGYIKGLGTMMERADTIVANTVWEAVHAQLQDFVQGKIPTMLRTSFKRKKEISRYVL